MSNQTAIIIPAKVEQSVQPKPRRTEIIEALALNRFEALKSESQRHKQKYEALEAELKTALIKLGRKEAKKAESTAALGHLNSRDYSDPSKGKALRDVYVAFHFAEEKLPPALRQQLREYHNWDRRKNYLPQFEDVKREVRDAMTGQVTNNTERVKAMLADPAASKALDQLLAQLGLGQAALNAAIVV